MTIKFHIQVETPGAVAVGSGVSLPHLEAFVRQFKPKRQLLVGGQGIALEEFLSKPASHWLP